MQLRAGELIAATAALTALGCLAYAQRQALEFITPSRPLVVVMSSKYPALVPEPTVHRMN